MSRVLAVARVHALDHAQIYWPWLIMGSSLAINMILWVTLEGLDGYDKGTGGLASLYITAGIVASIAVFQKLPFVLGLGAARRTFLLGTLIYGAVLAVLSGTALAVLNRVEAATDGFGLGGSFFRITWWTEVPGYLLPAVYAVPLLMVLMLGAMFAGISLRFGSNGLFVSAIAQLAVFAALAMLITWLDAWSELGSWLSNLTPMGLTGWLLLPTLVAGLVAWLTLRRAPV